MGSNEQQLFGCCVRKVEPLYEKASFMNDDGNKCVLNKYLNNFVFFVEELKNENRTTSPRGKQSNSFCNTTLYYSKIDFLKVFLYFKMLQMAQCCHKSIKRNRIKKKNHREDL